MKKILFGLIVALILFVLMSGCVQDLIGKAKQPTGIITPEGENLPQEKNPPVAYFKFTEIGPTHDINNFIFKLTDPAKIQHARNIWYEIETHAIHVSGKIIKTKIWYNSDWNYFLDPDSISFFENATEVCDARLAYVEANLSEACRSFLPKCQWCPWGSELTCEINPVTGNCFDKLNP